MKRRSRTVPPSRFRSRVLPAHHDTWEDAERHMFADDIERRRLDELTAELSEGSFDYPVCVGRDHWWSRRPRVLDGMHRAVAAMRLGIDIPVEHASPQKDGYADQDEYRVVVLTPHADPVTPFDKVLGLASFRCGDGFWLTCDVGSMDREGTGMLLQLPRRAHRREEVAAELAGRLRAAGIEALVVFAGEVQIDDDLLSR